jgi:AmmeMemoRadiSam system protein A
LLQHREILLALGRRTLELSTPQQANDASLRQRVYSSLGLDYNALPRAILDSYACFVTLIDQPSGLLRGCIGTLAARMPLADEVIHSTYETAFNDPRFVPVAPDEVAELRLELSILTPAQALPYGDPAQLPTLLRPHIDGVTLFIGERKATFLPQVWEKLSDPILFLESLCHKMGLPRHTWRDPQALKLAE